MIKISHQRGEWVTNCKMTPITIGAWIVLTFFRRVATEIHKKGFDAGYELRVQSSAPSRDSKGRFKGKGQ